MMINQIGKIVLDLSKYPGEDFYCDGAVEDELLEIVQNYPEEEYGRVIEERKNWPILYHLSYLRENIVDWIPMTKGMKVLEVGSGCGAITGALARKAGSVTCVELSKKRSTINATRHKDCDNVLIHVGNFKDVEPTLDTDFDMICLIGVFEYAQAYIGGKNPYEDFLNILKKHLKKDGRIIIAIENKYGLKYFAGCREDHTGTFFEGIENYNQGGGVRTFGRKGLEQIFKACGVEEYHFYYPYPDYKFPTSVYSDEYQPKKGELFNNLRNFDRDRLQLFDEKEVFDGLVEEQLFSVFSNSYLAVLGGDFEVKYVKYSNDRAPKYRIRTEIGKNNEGWSVRKYPAHEAAKEHVRGMETACQLLKERYAGGQLEINQCTLEETTEGVCAKFEYIDGVPLLEYMDGCLERKDMEAFYKYFEEYAKRVSYGEDSQVTAFDLVFGNLLLQGNKWTLIDYEWTYEKAISFKELAYRAVQSYVSEEEKRKCIDTTRMLKLLQITPEEAERLDKQEFAFQEEVKGAGKSMAELYALFGEDVVLPKDWSLKSKERVKVNRVQIYKDLGQGYSEENSYFLPDAFKDEQTVELEISFGAEVKMLRIDPAMYPCMCKIKELTFNGEAVKLDGRKTIIVNGQKVQGSEGLSIVFATEDPNININMEKLNVQKENILTAGIEVVRLPMNVAQELMVSSKKYKYSLPGLFR